MYHEPPSNLTRPQEALRMALAMQTALFRHKTERREQIQRLVQQKTILEEPSQFGSLVQSIKCAHMCAHFVHVLKFRQTNKP